MVSLCTRAYRAIALAVSSCDCVQARGRGAQRLRQSHGTRTVESLEPRLLMSDNRPDTMGKEFWLAFEQNYDNTGVTHDLFVTGREASSGIVEIPGLAFSAPFTVTPGQMTTVLLPSTTSVTTNDGTEDRGVHLTVTSGGDVAVYGLSRKQYTTDAYVGLPVDMLGEEHLVLSYPALGSDSNASQFAVVAAYDNTTITITPSVTTGSHTGGEQYQVTLALGQVYQLANTGTGDLTGSVVTSDHPVAVFSGNASAQVPVGTSYVDHLIEQIPTVALWGRSFVTVPLAGRTGGDTFRVLASMDNTEVWIGGTLVTTLGRGQFYETISTSAMSIEASAPVLIGQYANGHTYDNTTGDPFLSLVPPVEQYGNDYTLSTPESGFDSHYINIWGPARVGSVLLDGQPIAADQFTAVGTSGYVYARIPVSGGTHQVKSDIPVGVMIYGWTADDSYGYTGGGSLSYSESLSVLATTPSHSLSYNTDHIDVAFSRPVDIASLIPSEVVLTGPESVIPVSRIEVLSPSLCRIHFDPIVLSGSYSLRISAAVKDDQRNYLDQNGNGTGGEVGQDEFTATYSLDTRNLSLNQDVHASLAHLSDATQWQFSASSATQISFDLIARSDDGIVFDLAGPNGWTGFTGRSTDSDLITLPSAGTYTLTARRTKGQSVGTYAFRVTQTAKADLKLGDTVTGAFAGSGQAQLFAVVMPSFGPLGLVLSDADAAHHTEIYAKLGAPPTRGSYDYSASTTGANHRLLIPQATAGTWYILVYGDNIPTAGSYTLTATTYDIAVKSFTPDHAGNGANTVLTINGVGFDAGTVMDFVAADGTTTYRAKTTEVDSYAMLTATFAGGAVPAGTYTLRVTNSGGKSDQVTNAFTMKSGGQAHLVTNLVVPSVVGYHQTSTLYVTYSNDGDVAMPAPLLVVSATMNNLAGAFLALDSSVVGQGFWTSATPTGFSHSVQILASGNLPGVLQPGETIKVPVYYAGWENDQWDFSRPLINFSVGALTATDTTPTDWSSMKSSMQPATLTADAWNAVWSNFTSQVGTTWGQYVGMLDDNATYLGRLGENVRDIGSLLSFEMAQASGLGVVSTLSSATDASVSAPGLAVAFSRSYSVALTNRFTVDSFGYGWSNNWDYSLATASDGTVTITLPGGGQRVFQPDSRNSNYFAQAGDYGTLTKVGGGIFMLREKDGTVQGFRADGKLDYVQDTNANRITCGYTGNQLTTLTASSGQSLTIHYNAAGRIDSITDSLSRATTFTYDPSNLYLLSETNWIGQTTRYTYDASASLTTAHALQTIAYPDGIHQYYTYDSHGRLASSSLDGNTQKLTYSYDSAGKVTVTNALGNASQYFFNENGQIVKVVDALGNGVFSQYGYSGNLTSVTDPAGRSTSYAYDTKGNLIKSVDALGNATKYAYTTTYNELATLTDANGNVTKYGYDASGNLNSITYADGTKETWTYNTSGEAQDWTNRRGHAVSYTYDSAGHLLTQTYQDSSSATFAYDTYGNLTSTVDPTGTTTFDYYPDTHFLKRIAYPGGQYLQYTYDAGGRRTQMVNELGNQTNYFYDTAGRLWKETDETGASIIVYSYDAAGQLQREDKGNGTYTTYEYDAAGNVLHLINHAPNGLVNSRFDYTYDSRGRRMTMATIDGAWTYSYDDISQLTHAVFASTNSQIANQDLTYVYDAMGNRIYTIENGVRSDYTTNNMNQYTQVGDTTYTYDADGNLIQESGPGDTTTFTYNDNNGLTGLASGSDNWAYSYDARGYRTATMYNGATAGHIIDPAGFGNVVGEYTMGSLITRYAYGIGLVNEVTADHTISYYSFDATGSTAGVSDSDGTSINKYSYTPFGGELISRESVSNPFTYVGQWGVSHVNETLDLMGARLYANGTGQFTSEDPLGYIGGSFNYREYAGNCPISLADPTGLFLAGDFFVASAKTVGAGIGVAAALAASPFTGGASILPAIASAYAFGVGFGNMVNAATDVKPVLGGGLFGDLALLSPSQDARDLGTLVDLSLSAGKTPTLSVSASFTGAKGIVQTTSKIVNLGVSIWKSGKSVYDSLHAVTPPVTAVGSRQSVVATSQDPNAKIGPSGYGSSGYIGENGVLPYTIQFENDKVATAPAQQVVITDNLDSNLDWSAFSFTEIGFGDQRIAIPAGSQHFETTVSMTYNGQTFEVSILADLRLATGQIYVIIQSIDPNTSLPPDVLTGFLPPEDGTGRGMGYVSYTIQPKAGLATGTQIKNVALITFDQNPAIATDQIDPHDASKGTDPTKDCLNTIDAGGPTTGAQLGQVNPQGRMPVSWLGTDADGGSGLAGYDVYVSDNGGAYTLWQDHTTATSETYAGQNGHTYAFYSLGYDNVGNEEVAPVAADAQTTVHVTSPAAGLELSSSVVKEKLAARTVVGTLTPTEAEAGGVFTYSLVSGGGSADNAAFKIVGGRLKTMASFNYDAKNRYAIRVRMTDQDGMLLNRKLVVTVIPANTRVPVALAVSSAKVAENQLAGTFVGTLAATDPNPGDTFSYKLAAGGVDNAAFKVTADGRVKTRRAFDFETKRSYSILVRSTDQGGLFCEKPITIRATDVNEAPTDVALTNYSVRQKSPAGTLVGKLIGTDPDAGNTLTYSLVGGTGSRDNATFTLLNGKLKTADVFRYAVKSVYKIRVRVTDQGGLWYEKAMVVGVTR